MEGKSPSLSLQKHNWIFRQSINREFLRSYSGIINIAEMVGLATSFGALQHYVTLVSMKTVADTLFFTTSGVAYFVTLIIFLVKVFDFQKKNLKFWNAFIVMFTSVTAVLLLVLSSFLANEAIKLGDSFHETPLQPKCVSCSKINIASMFGFISSILFIVDFFLYVRQYGFPCSKRKGRQVTVQQVKVTPMTENEEERTI